MNNGWKALVITSILLIIFSNFAYAEKDRIEIGPWAYDIAVNPNQNLIYVSHDGVLIRSGVCQDFFGIGVFDGSTYEVLDYIDIDGIGKSGLSMEYDAENDLLYATYDSGDDKITYSVIDGKTNEIISVNKGYSLDDWRNFVFTELKGLYETVNPNNGKIYRGNLLARAVYVIDDDPYTPEKIIPISDGPNDVTINPITNIIYTANSGNIDKLGQSISVIDGNSDTVIDTIELEKRPSQVYINPSTNNLYVFSYYTKSILVLDGTTYEKIAEFETNGQPSRIAVSPETQTIYALNTGGMNILSVIDMSTNSISELQSKHDNTGVRCPAAEEKFGSYFATYLNYDIIFAFILLGMIYLTRFTESRSTFDAKNMQKVNVKLQMLFSALPAVWIWTLYRIKKIRKGLLLILGFKIFFGGTMAFFFIPFPYDFMVFFAIVTPIFVYVFRAWSIEWNEKLIESIRTSSGSQPIH